MPFLKKGQELFIHIPRCAGTSIISKYKVQENAVKDEKNCFKRACLRYFFYRYKLLETQNYPIYSYETLFALVSLLCIVALWLAGPFRGPLIFFAFTSLNIFICSTFIMNTNLAKHDILRKALHFFVGRIMPNMFASEHYLHGVSGKYYLMHATPNQLLNAELVTMEDLKTAFAVVRNPYTRMVSLYHYNKTNPFQSFKSFVKQWKRKLDNKSDGSYCHILPQVDFILYGEDNELKVRNIIKHEELHLICQGTIFGEYTHSISDKVVELLKELPRTNGRSSSKHWSKYYDQETKIMVDEMYHDDFVLLGYPKII